MNNLVAENKSFINVTERTSWWSYRIRFHILHSQYYNVATVSYSPKTNPLSIMHYHYQRDILIKEVTCNIPPRITIFHPILFNSSSITLGPAQNTTFPITSTSSSIVYSH
jgi:hypothetical protein